MAIDNLHTVKGTVFSKDVKTGASKKQGEPDWEMCIMKIEADVLIKGKTLHTVCEYLFDWGVSFNEFSVADPIVADFFIINKKIKKKDGTGSWEKEEKRIVYAKFGDLNSSWDNNKGKITVTAMSDVKDLGMPPTPDTGGDNEGLDDLPF
jgi:hypothetical protein